MPAPYDKGTADRTGSPLARTPGNPGKRAAITAENLVREFGQGHRAVDGVDLEVAPGEILPRLMTEGPLCSSRRSTWKKQTCWPTGHARHRS